VSVLGSGTAFGEKEISSTTQGFNTPVEMAAAENVSSSVCPAHAEMLAP
jgi:hypothetical protein